MKNLTEDLRRGLSYLEEEGLGAVKPVVERLLGFDFDLLCKEGIYRDHDNYRFVVTYPFNPLMNTLKEDVFKDYSPEKPLALYVHLPFCLSICSFCGRFIKTNQISQEKINQVVDSAISESKLIHSKIEGNLVFDSVYFGGGTPSVLSDPQIKRLLDYFVGELNLKKGAEVSWETTPETAIHEKLDLVLERGVNRISMGVQDFDSSILRDCNRLHDGKKAVSAIELIHEMGFKNLNVDFIHGLPNQTLKHREKTLETVLDLKPNSITDYPLYTSQDACISNLPSKSFPESWVRLVMQARASDVLIDAGYSHRPIHWFTLRGSRHIQQENKFRNQEVLGIGLSSYSYLNGYQYVNMSDVGSYLHSIENEEYPLEKGIKLSKHQDMARYMIFGMKLGDVEKKEYRAKYGESLDSKYSEIIGKLVEIDVLFEDQNQLKLTPLGELFSEEAALAFTDSETKALVSEQGCTIYGNY
ncbi:MAG: coproporphyrinogen-III oxidase family protein [Candidatus Altiarchaeota archaeon]